MATVHKYMSITSKDKKQKFSIDVTYHSTLSTKLDLVKALKYCGTEIKGGWIKKTNITITNLETGLSKKFVYGTDFTAKSVNPDELNVGDSCIVNMGLASLRALKPLK